MTTTRLVLGGVHFQNFEIPQRINFGGMQSLAVKQLVGGRRIVDAMGRIDDDISWSGLLFESNALERAQLLDILRVNGAPMPLVFSELNFIVAIKSFRASFERNYQIPYEITVTVIQDLNKPFALLEAVGYANAVASLMTEIQFLADAVSDPNIVSAVAALNVAISSIPDLSIATGGQISSLTPYLNSAQSATSNAISNLGSSTFGS